MIKIILNHSNFCSLCHSMIEEYNLDTDSIPPEEAINKIKKTIAQTLEQAYVVEWENSNDSFNMVWKIVFPNEQGYMVFRLKYPDIKADRLVNDGFQEHDLF